MSAVVTALAVGMGAVGGPGTAHAQSSGDGAAAEKAAAAVSVGKRGVVWHIPETSCAPLGGVEWWGPIFNTGSYFGYLYTVVSAVKVFNVADARQVNNQLDEPVPATFSSTVTRSWSVQTSLTFTTSEPLVDSFNIAISTTIVQSVSTAINVSTTVQVPAHTTVIADYGVDAYDVVYDAMLVGLDTSTGKCYDGGTTRASANAPTYVEGWRLRYAPI